MTQKSSDPDAADLSWRRSFEAHPVPEEELWFLPGPAEDLDWDPRTPPLPRADRRLAFVPVAWRKAQGDLAAELAQVAVLFGALEERLRRLGQGARQRLALLEAAELSWHSGDRVAPDRLGMWVSLRLSNPQDEACLILNLAPEYKGATARHTIYGGQWRRLDRKMLGLFKDRS
jgi:hypothetical protein